MKQKQLLRTLLAAVCLLVGTNAWGKTYSGSVSFAAQNRITNNGDGTFTTAGNAGNEYALAIADLSGLENISSASSITLEFDVTVSGRLLIGIGDKNVRGTTANGSSKSTYNTDGLVMRYGTSDGTYVRVNGGTNNSNLLNASSHVTFTLDRTTGKYSYTITYVNGESETVTGLSGSNISTSVDNATIIEMYSWSNSTTFTISDVSYSYEYTASSFNYAVNAVDGEGNIIKVLSSGTSTEAVTYYYPYVVEKDGVYYTTSATTFATEVTSINPTRNIVYTADESIVYFSEAESESGTNASYSNGNTGHVGAPNYHSRGKSLGNYDAGVYSVCVYVTGATNRTMRLRSIPTTYNAGTNTANDDVTLASITASLGLQSANFALPETKQLILNGADNGTKALQTFDYDYVIIRKISDATGEIVGDVNYTTNYSNAWNTLPIWINAGETAYYKFVNYNNTASANLFENWYLFGATEASENVVIFGPNHSNTATNATYSSKPTFTMADLNGATVELTTTLTKDGETYTLTTTGVTTKADGTTLSPDLVYTQTGLTSSKLKLYVSVEKSWLEIIEQAVKKPIGTYGYATFSSTNAVNVDVDGLEAYIVTGKSESGSSIKTEKITGDVAAGTGLILKGNAGTYSLPVVASGTTYNQSSDPKNYLFACDGSYSEVAAAGEGGTNYVLSVQNNKVVFAPIGTTPAPVNAGQAALWLPASGNAKALALSFGDDVTGIDAVSTVEPQGAKTYYNLQGQRVSEPKQGIYVVDGKKVLVK